jgi:hypothetical protein
MDKALVAVGPILPKRRGQIWDNNQVPMEVCWKWIDFKALGDNVFGLKSQA